MANKKKKKADFQEMLDIERPKSLADLGLPEPGSVSRAESVVAPLGSYREAQAAAIKSALRARALQEMGPVMPSVVGQGAGGGILTAASAISNAILAKAQLEEARQAAEKTGQVPQAGFGLESADIRNNPNYFFGNRPYQMYQQLQRPQQYVSQGTPLSLPLSLGGPGYGQ